ncbi:MFS transporter [Streptomyces sp. NPDC049040]|uniref:MFS transporter n=1 Tax=Streptomyces sp. NPDC049040 TaxID=3365593 RepID=UPI0037125A30
MPTSPDVEPESEARSPWRPRDFLLLWGGQAVSEMGSAVTTVALPLVAVVALKASTFQVGLPAAAATAAFAVVALPAGAIVDRGTKRSIMIVCGILRLLAIGSIPLVAAFGTLTMAQLHAVARPPVCARCSSTSPTRVTCCR